MISLSNKPSGVAVVTMYGNEKPPMFWTLEGAMDGGPLRAGDDAKLSSLTCPLEVQDASGEVLGHYLWNDVRDLWVWYPWSAPQTACSAKATQTLFETGKEALARAVEDWLMIRSSVPERVKPPTGGTRPDCWFSLRRDWVCKTEDKSMTKRLNEQGEYEVVEGVTGGVAKVVIGAPEPEDVAEPFVFGEAGDYKAAPGVAEVVFENGKAPKVTKQAAPQFETHTGPTVGGPYGQLLGIGVVSETSPYEVREGDKVFGYYVWDRDHWNWEELKQRPKWNMKHAPADTILAPIEQETLLEDNTERARKAEARVAELERHCADLLASNNQLLERARDAESRLLRVVEVACRPCAAPPVRSNV